MGVHPPTPTATLCAGSHSLLRSRGTGSLCRTTEHGNGEEAAQTPTLRIFLSSALDLVLRAELVDMAERILPGRPLRTSTSSPRHRQRR